MTFFTLGSKQAYKGVFSFPEDIVKARLSDIHFPPNRIKIIPGFIEKTINSPNLPKKVCFAYLDFDLYEPILIALHFLETVLQPRGFIIIDDYDYFTKGPKFAVDEFYESRKEKYSMIFPLRKAGKFCILSKKI
jgi:O-methyltransferase